MAETKTTKINTQNGGWVFLLLIGLLFSPILMMNSSNVDLGLHNEAQTKIVTASEIAPADSEIQINGNAVASLDQTPSISATPAATSSEETNTNMTAAPPINTPKSALFSYDFTQQYDISQVGWQKIGDPNDTCWYTHAEGITVNENTSSNEKCILFHENPQQLAYNKISLTATLDDLTSTGIVVIRNEGNPDEDDFNYYRFIIDTGIGGSYRSVIQVVYKENGNVKTRDIAEKPYDYKSGIPYTITVKRDGHRFSMYVSESGKTPALINETPLNISYKNISKIGFKITDVNPGDNNRVFVKEFSVY